MSYFLQRTNNGSTFMLLVNLKITVIVFNWTDLFLTLVECFLFAWGKIRKNVLWKALLPELRDRKLISWRKQWTFIQLKKEAPNLLNWINATAYFTDWYYAVDFPNFTVTPCLNIKNSDIAIFWNFRIF